MSPLIIPDNINELSTRAIQLQLEEALVKLDEAAIQKTGAICKAKLKSAASRIGKIIDQLPAPATASLQLFEDALTRVNIWLVLITTGHVVTENLKRQSFHASQMIKCAHGLIEGRSK